MLPASVPTAVLSGPTFAREVGAGLPTAMTIASADHDSHNGSPRRSAPTTFRAYTSTDIVGVEVGGATKNVYAIGAGICDGLQFRRQCPHGFDRAQSRGDDAAWRSRSAGARRRSWASPAWAISCSPAPTISRVIAGSVSPWRAAKRRRRAARIGQVVEGYNAARAVLRVAARLAVPMPIAEQLDHVLHEAADPKAAVAALDAAADRRRARLTRVPAAAKPSWRQAS